MAASVGMPGDPLIFARAKNGRVVSVDLARSLALLGMIVFHATRDLEFFAILPPGTTLNGGWAILARLVAGSFMFLAGVSLVLAHGDGLRSAAFLRRLAVIAAAAAVVTLATLTAFPGRFVYFGILHAVAAGSLLCLPFVRALPASAALAAAAGILTLHASGAAPFETPLLGWTGLSATVRPSLDLIPLVPWLAPMLLGVFTARLWRPRPELSHGPLLTALAWPGRHSLAVYLVHQPLILGLIWLLLNLPEVSS